MESVSYFIGDCKALDDYLKLKHGPAWGLLKFLNALFRGVGQVVFANNPWSGLIILASLYWASIEVGFATTVASTTAILTAIVFKQDESKISAGITTYNAVLVGSVTASIWEPTYGEPIGWVIWGFIVLGAALSVLMNVALINIFGSFKPPLPSFTLAFNIVTILIFWTLQPRTNRGFKKSIQQSTFLDLIQGRVEKNNSVDILSVIQGILLSMGQVYAVQNLEGSVAMYVATILYSPIVCIMSLIGASVGSFFGIVFDGPSYSNVYAGIYGFNAILAAIAVGAFFYVPTSLSLGVAVADVALAVLIQRAINLSFTPLKLPFLTYPFVISSIFFLEVTATGELLTRVSKYSYPEQHLRDFIDSKRQMKENHGVMMMMEDSKPKMSPSPTAPLLPTHHQSKQDHFRGNTNTNSGSIYPILNEDNGIHHEIQHSFNPLYDRSFNYNNQQQQHHLPNLYFPHKYKNSDVYSYKIQ